MISKDYIKLKKKNKLSFDVDILEKHNTQKRTGFIKSDLNVIQSS